MLCDVDPIDWLNKFYGFYTEAVVNTISGGGIRIHTCYKTIPKRVG